MQHDRIKQSKTTIYLFQKVNTEGLIEMFFLQINFTHQIDIIIIIDGKRRRRTTRCHQLSAVVLNSIKKWQGAAGNPRCNESPPIDNPIDTSKNNH